MKRMLAAAVILVFAPAAGRAEVVGQRWGSKGAKITHPGTLEIVHSSVGTRLVFDLSAISRRARVYHASMYCFTSGDRQPTDSPKIHLTDRLDAEGNPAFAGKPLGLEAPWYRSFDATEAVRRWVKDPKRNLGLTVARFEGLEARRTVLEVRYEGKARDLPEQATGVRAVHHDGQTFIVWKEVAAFRPKDDEVMWLKKFAERGDEPAEGPGQGAYGMPNHPGITLRTLRQLQGLGLRTDPSPGQEIRPLKRVREVPAIRYRIYRHTEKITARNIRQAEVLADVGPLSGYDTEVYKIHFQGEYLNQREEPSSFIPTLCVDKGSALAPGEGLYVHTTKQPGKSYYAVTTILAGTENLSKISDANSLPQAAAETPATPQPVLQWVQQDAYNDDPTEYWYRYWAARPYCNLPSRSLRVAVAVPNKFAPPGEVAPPEVDSMAALPLSIGTISGASNVRGSIGVPPADRITLLPERQLAWLPALFYNEGMGTLRGMRDCKVDYFSERYMSFMIKWIMRSYKIDRARIAGSLLHFGLRHPEIFTRMQMGTYTAGYDLRWAPGGPSMPRVLGPRGIKTVQGEDAWAMYSVGEYVNTYPGRDIPFLVCISGTGKDGGHTSEFGWQDDPRGWAELLKGRQTFVAAWSCGLPGELSAGLNRMRWDVSIPAFSYCSLDNNPGNGDPTDGDYYGCINGWLLWGDKDQIDEKDRWEMTVWVISSCPEQTCTVDITPRRCKNFRPARGRKFKWTNTSLADNREIQSGTVTADQWGLVTIKAVKVSKGRNRIAVFR